MAHKKTLLLKLALYLGPVGVYVMLTVGVATWAGELTPLADVARRQMTTPLLYGRAYRDNYFAFKLVSVKARRPELLVVGSSRAMQFRSDVATRNAVAFYNAGGASQSLDEMRRFLEMLAPAAAPKVAILGLDQWWFNPKHSRGPSAQRLQDQIDEENALASTRALNVGRFVLRDLASGKIPPQALLLRRDPSSGIEALGMNAIVNGNGFRNDGSWQYGQVVLHPGATEERLREGFERLRTDRDHFSSAAHVDEGGLSQVAALLELSRRHGIVVVGFSPPYAPSIYARMSAGGRHGYLAEMAAGLRAVFARRGFPYFDFSDGAVACAADDDMIDAFHASEVVHLRMYLTMLRERPDILAPYSDTTTLKRLETVMAAGRLGARGAEGRRG